MPRQQSVQFRERVLGLVENGRDVGDPASELGMSAATIYRWRNQAGVDAGKIAGVNSAVAAHLADARMRIRELEEELAATQFTASIRKGENIRPKDGSQSLKP